MKRNWLPVLKVSVIALLIAGLSVACSGGGGGRTTPPPGGMMPGGLVASFGASNPTPGPMTLSMAPGPSNEESFSILVQVTGIDDFFGAGFRVNFDPATADFTGVDSTGSFILGVMTDIDAVENLPNVPGELLVTATRQGQVAGVDPTGDDLLITLSFDATTATAGNVFSFGVAANRLVETCATAVDPCVMVPDGMLTWSGGTMTAM